MLPRQPEPRGPNPIFAPSRVRDPSNVAPAPILRYQIRRALDTGAPVAAEACIRGPFRRTQAQAPDNMDADTAGWMLRAACADAAHWGNLRLAIALSARQLQSAALPEQIADALAITGLPPDQLELILTEPPSDLAEGELALDTLLLLCGLRDLGIGLALDDFGGANASLLALRRLPLSAVKLSRALLRDGLQSREDQAFARAVVDTAHAVGLPVTADGIETDAQVALAAKWGCTDGQGALFGPLQTGPVLRGQLRHLTKP